MATRNPAATASKTSLRELAHRTIKDLATDFGKKDAYSRLSGITEISEQFGREKECVGLYTINGVPMYFIDEHKLCTEKQKLFKSASVERTPHPGIFLLKEGEVAVISEHLRGMNLDSGD